MDKEIRFNNSSFLILEADAPERYEALRKLWCSVFGDDPQYVDSMFECFGDEIKGYIVADDVSVPDIRALSAMVCYKCGDLTISDADMEEVCGKPVYVSYAVCTDPEFRGMGLAGALTAYIRDLVTDAGGLSLVSPAEESLQSFYSGLGYRPFFYASESIAYADEILAPAGPGLFDDDLFEDDPEYDFFDGFYEPHAHIEEFRADEAFEPVEPALDVAELDAAAYNRYREAFLIDEPHIVMSGRMMEFVRMDSFNGNGLFAINGGDAICAVNCIEGAEPASGSGREQGRHGRLVLNELIVNPVLEEISAEIGSEIAGRLAAQFGAAVVEYREPGMRCCQSMIAGKLAVTEAGMPKAGYFGFPLD